HARRDAADGASGVSIVGIHGAVPGAIDLGVLSAISAPGAGRMVAGSGDRAPPAPGDEPRRGDRAVGVEGMSEERPAFYALAAGGWRDYWTLLHPPYTAWHLSYVAIGAAVATHFDGGRLGATVLAFFLAVGLTAHALDELAGRPLRTRIPDRVLRVIAAVGLVGAVAIGVVGAVKVSWWLLAFVGVGALGVVAYNLELAGGRLHSDLWFALLWGALPA